MPHQPEADELANALRAIYRAIVDDLPVGSYVSITAAWQTPDSEALRTLSYSVIDDEHDVDADVDDREVCP